MTAMLWGLRNGCSETVQLLLDYNADPNICAKVNHSIITFNLLIGLLLYRMAILHCILLAKKVMQMLYSHCYLKGQIQLLRILTVTLH